MGWIMDGVILLFFVYFIVRGKSRGFIATFISFIGSFVATVASAMVSSWLSPLLFGKYIRQPLIDGLISAFTNNAGSDLTSSITAALEGMPDFIQEFVNENIVVFTQDMESGVNESVRAGATQFVDNSLQPMIQSVLYLMIFLVLTALLNVLVRFVVKRLEALNRIPVIGGLNSVLGAGIGFLQGLLMAYLILALINLFIALTGNLNPYMNTAVINNSILTQYFYYNNPFLDSSTGFP